MHYDIFDQIKTIKRDKALIMYNKAVFMAYFPKASMMEKYFSNMEIIFKIGENFAPKIILEKISGVIIW